MGDSIPTFRYLRTGANKCLECLRCRYVESPLPMMMVFFCAGISQWARMKLLTLALAGSSPLALKGLWKEQQPVSMLLLDLTVSPQLVPLSRIYMHMKRTHISLSFISVLTKGRSLVIVGIKMLAEDGFICNLSRPSQIGGHKQT